MAPPSAWDVALLEAAAAPPPSPLPPDGPLAPIAEDGAAWDFDPRVEEEEAFWDEQEALLDELRGQSSPESPPAPAPPSPPPPPPALPPPFAARRGPTWTEQRDAAVCEACGGPATCGCDRCFRWLCAAHRRDGPDAHGPLVLGAVTDLCDLCAVCV